MHCNLSFYLSLEQLVLLQHHTAITVLSDAGRQYETRDACEAGHFWMAEVIMCPESYWITVYKTHILLQVSQCNSLCTWLASTMLSVADMEEPFQLPWTSSSRNTVLLNWTSDPAVQPKAYCLYCLAVWSLHYLAAALTPLHSYPCSGWKMQQLVSCSEPWCSAGGKGYQTAGILARLTRLCTLRLSVKIQLCLLSFHIPKQTEEAIVSKINQNLVNIRPVFIYSALKVVLKREVLDENSSFRNEPQEFHGPGEMLLLGDSGRNLSLKNYQK